MKILPKLQNHRAFTLVELLVVISIIGLLSSIVLVSVQSAREKGIIAAAQKFDTYNYHAFGADALGMWKFDGVDMNGDKVDSSSYNNALSFVGSSGSINYNPGGNAGGVYNTSGIQFNTNVNTDYALATIPNNYVGNNWTISVWVKPTIINGTQIFISFSTPYFAYRGGGEFSMSYDGSGNAVIDQSREINKWYHILVTYTASPVSTDPGVESLYVNGKLIGKHDISQSVGTIKGRPIYIGNHSSATLPFRGVVDELRVYSQSLGISEIQQLYAEGAPRHGIAINK